jgi:hypothetical protein
MATLADLLMTALGLLLLACACMLLLLWRLWRHLRRSVQWRYRMRTAQVWLAPPGVRREVAALRRELVQSVAATPHALTIVRATGGAVGELPLLARRLERVAATLDAELALLASEPDMAEVARVLPAAHARVADVRRVARTIRRAAGAGLGVAGAASVRALGADVEREVAALDAGVQLLLTMTTDDPVRRSA